MVNGSFKDRGFLKCESTLALKLHSQRGWLLFLTTMAARRIVFPEQPSLGLERNDSANLSLIPEDWTQDFSDDLKICPIGQHLLTLTVCWAGTSWRGITRNRSPDKNLIVSWAAGNCQNICQDSGLGRMKAIILLDKLEHNGFKVEQRNKFQESLTIRNF